MTTCTDEELLALLRHDATRERGFRLLVARYGGQLYRLIRPMVGSHEDADDVLQNCLVKVFRGIGQFEGKSALYTWLYRIATNEALTFVAQQQRRPTTVPEEAATHHPAADLHFDGQAAQARLAEAVTKLPEKQRLVFELRYFQDMAYAEMSRQLGTSQGALKASYHHAVKKIEAMLKA